jgi:hypothetical protein
MGLLELMLGEKLEQQAEMVRAEGWAWVEVSAAYGYEERRQHGRLPNVLSPETPEQEARRIALESQMGHLSAELKRFRMLKNGTSHRDRRWRIRLTRLKSSSVKPIRPARCTTPSMVGLW